MRAYNVSYRLPGGEEGQLHPLKLEKLHEFRGEDVFMTVEKLYRAVRHCTIRITRNGGWYDITTNLTPEEVWERVQAEEERKRDEEPHAEG